jgi:DNA repair exonuclease SbcCD ATPase subunit
MERISAKKKDTTIRLYLSGLSYDEIAARTGVSKGTIFNIIAELKAGKFPEAADADEQIELLRELSVEIKRSRLTPGQCSVGLAVLNRINECGLDPADIDRWPSILREVGSEEQAREFVKLIYNIQEVQKNTGLSLGDLDDKVHELEEKASQLEPMAKEHDECKEQLIELTKQRDSLTKEVGNLEEKHKMLNSQVKDLEKHERDLSRRTQDLETRSEKTEAVISALHSDETRLRVIGLTPEKIAEFSQRLSVMVEKHDIPPQQLKGRLFLELENLDHALSQEELIVKDQQIMEGHEKFVAKAKLESEELNAVVGDLKQEKANLEAGIKEIEEYVRQDIVKIIPAAGGLHQQ